MLLLVNVTLKGNTPAVNPFERQIKSGVILAYSQASILPHRPMPVIISSAIK